MKRVPAALFLLLTLAGTTASGEEEPARPVPAGPPAGASPLFVEMNLQGFAPADFSEGAGTISDFEYGTSIGWNRFSRDGTRYGLRARYRHTEYDLDAPAPIGGSFQSVNRFNLEGLVGMPLSGPWGFDALFLTSWQAEEEASLGDGFNALVSAGVSYRFSPRFQVAAMVLAFYRPEDDPLIIPVPSFRWRPNDRLLVYTANGIFGEYTLDPERTVTLVGSVSYTSRGFAVADLAGFTEVRGAVEESFVEWVLGIEKRLGKQFEVRAGIHAITFRDFEYLRDKEEFASFETDATLGLSAAFQWRF